MTISHATTAKRTWATRAGIGGAAAFALVIGGIAVQANATSAFTPYDEENPNPIAVTEGLVFFTNADLGWFVNAPIADVESLSYTIAAGEQTKPLGSGEVAPTAYAPSFQLVVHADQKSYARLVWEPYMQAGSLDPVKGEYTNLQDGLWWTSKIANPNPGSQSSPQPLAFFQNGGGAGWTNVGVTAIDVHQGSTSQVTSVLTKVSYNGSDVPLGNADTTRFNQADIDAAVAAAEAPLNAQIGDLSDDLADANDQISDLTDDLADANDQIADLQHDLAAAQSALSSSTGPLGTQIASLQAQLTAAESALTAYKNTHHTADGTNIGTSRALLSATPVHAKTVGVKLQGTIATKATSVKYAWYVGGKPVFGASKATFKVPASAAGKTISVKVTGTYKNIVFSVNSNAIAAK